MDWSLYKQQPAFVIGFHGCDKSTVEEVLAGNCELRPSINNYDWLGDGIYFWEGSPARAYEFAASRAMGGKGSKGTIKIPCVIGAVIDLGYCFNLMDSQAIDELGVAYESLKQQITSSGKLHGMEMPKNTGGDDLVKRFLDRSVIEFMHHLRTINSLPAYDTARAAFFEGGRLYPDAGFTKRAHIQVAVRHTNSIKCYFRPKQPC